jgi:V/A-type H+-transporting ATPase subunit E
MEAYQESSEKLRTEILEEAKRRGEEIIKQARQDAEALLARAAEEAERLREDMRNQADAEAERRSAFILATVPVEAGKIHAARIEELLDTIHEEASRRLVEREGFDYSKAMIVLVSQAILQMAGDAFVVKLSEADKALLGENFVEEVVKRAGRQVKITCSLEQDTMGGVIIEDEDARQVWDNRLLRRLERMWPELRRQIAARVLLGSEKRATGGLP